MTSRAFEPTSYSQRVVVANGKALMAMLHVPLGGGSRQSVSFPVLPRFGNLRAGRREDHGRRQLRGVRALASGSVLTASPSSSRKLARFEIGGSVDGNREDAHLEHLSCSRDHRRSLQRSVSQRHFRASLGVGRETANDAAAVLSARSSKGDADPLLLRVMSPAVRTHVRAGALFLELFQGRHPAPWL